MGEITDLVGKCAKPINFAQSQNFGGFSSFDRDPIDEYIVHKGMAVRILNITKFDQIIIAGNFPQETTEYYILYSAWKQVPWAETPEDTLGCPTSEQISQLDNTHEAWFNGFVQKLHDHYHTDNPSLIKERLERIIGYFERNCENNSENNCIADPLWKDAHLSLLIGYCVIRNGPVSLFESHIKYTKFIVDVSGINVTHYGKIDAKIASYDEKY